MTFLNHFCWLYDLSLSHFCKYGVSMVNEMLLHSHVHLLLLIQPDGA